MTSSVVTSIFVNAVKNCMYSFTAFIRDFILSCLMFSSLVLSRCILFLDRVVNIVNFLQYTPSILAKPCLQTEMLSAFILTKYSKVCCLLLFGFCTFYAVANEKPLSSEIRKVIINLTKLCSRESIHFHNVSYSYKGFPPLLLHELCPGCRHTLLHVNAFCLSRSFF